MEVEQPEIRVIERERTPSPVLPPVDELVDTATRVWRSETASKQAAVQEIPTPDGARRDDDVHVPEGSEHDVAETHDGDARASVGSEHNVAEIHDGDASAHTSTPIVSPIVTSPAAQGQELVTTGDVQHEASLLDRQELDHVTKVVTRPKRRGPAREGSAPPTVDTSLRTRLINLLRHFVGSPAATTPARSLSVVTPTSPMQSQALLRPRCFVFKPRSSTFI